MRPARPIVHVNAAEETGAVASDEVVQAVRATLESEGVSEGEVSVTFVDTEGIVALNARHLGRTRPTDVIAFNLGDAAAPLGDIYICPEVARDSAREYDVEPREELLRLVVHGVLHVLGYEHPHGPDRHASDMFRRQEEILSRLL